MDESTVDDIAERRPNSAIRLVRGLALLTIAYAAVAYVGLNWALVSGAGSPIWPAAGVGLAGLAIGGPRLWPAIVAGRLLAAALAGSSQPLWVDLIVAAGNAAGPVAAVMLLERFRVDPALPGLSSMLRYIVLGAGGSALVAAAIGGLAVSTAAGLDAGDTMTILVIWTLGNFAGVLTVGPLIQSWWYGGRLDKPLYLGLVLALLTVVCFVFFSGEYTPYFRTWHLMPLLIWAGLAFQLRGASAALLILAGFSAWQLGRGYVSFTDDSLAISDRIPLLQQFLSIEAITILLLAALVQDRLRSGADRLHLALDAARQGVFEFDVGRGVVACDSVARDLLQIDRNIGTVTLDRIAQHVWPEDRAIFSGLARDMVEGSGGRRAAGGYQAEFRVQAVAGGPRWISVHGRTTFEGLGPRRRAVSSYGVVRDITERKVSEERVRESERFVRRVLDNLFVFVAVLTRDGTLVEVNRAPLEAGGLAAGEVRGKKFWDAAWWSYSSEVQRRLEQAAGRAAGGEVVRYDERGRAADGGLYWIDLQIAPLRDAEGVITHLIASGTDLTARKAAETDLRQLNAIIEATPDFVGIADPDGRVVYINPGGRAMIGAGVQEDLSGRSIDTIHPADAMELVRSTAFPAALRDGVWKGTSEIVDRQGTRIPVSQVIVAHRNDQGTLVQYSTIMRDMTEQKRAETQQRLLLRELAHRVRNTLAVIQSIARQTLRSNPEPKRFAEVFQGRIASLAASHSLLTDSEWQGADLSAVIRSQLAPVIGDAKGRLTLDGPAVVMPSEGATKLGLVLHELGTNAAKYGAWAGPRGKVRISWQVENDTLRISWVERGGPPVAEPGRKGFGTSLIDMSVETIERHFEPEGLRLELTIPMHSVFPAK